MCMREPCCLTKRVVSATPYYIQYSAAHGPSRCTHACTGDRERETESACDISAAAYRYFVSTFMHNTTTNIQLYLTTEGWPPIIQVRGLGHQQGERVPVWPYWISLPTPPAQLSAHT